MTITPLRTPLAGLPDLAVPGHPASPLPSRLLTGGPLLLRGSRADRALTHSEHRDAWGEPVHPDLPGLIDAVRTVKLLGAGGAAFPTERKLAAMARRRVERVVINAAEGEPTSAKDSVLLAHVPHLVLDGAEAVARALGAPRITIRVGEDRTQAIRAATRAIEERADADRRNRGCRIDVSIGPARFVAGESTAVINALSGGPALPGDLGLPPVAPGNRLRRRHVFLSNVETFARLAAAVRGDRRRSALITVCGAVGSPGVLEVDPGVTLGQVADWAGIIGAPEYVITGGWHGAWVRWPDAGSAVLTREAIAAIGGRWGAGSFTWIPDTADPRAVLTAIAGRLARESAGQCGPCAAGLPALAAALSAGDDRSVPELLAAVDGRGICAHPSATASAVRSAVAAMSR